MTTILSQAGFSVEILTCDEKTPVAPYLSVPVHSFPKTLPVRFSNSSGAIEYLKGNIKKYDLVCIHCIWTALCIRAAQYCLLNKVPYIIVPHSSLDPFDLQKKKLLKSVIGPLFLKRILKQAWCILCSTPREASNLVSYGANARTHVLSWPVPGEPGEISRETARSTLKLREDDFVILALGRVDYKKGFPILIPVVRKLREKFSNARLIIVGPDTNGYTEKVRQMIAENGVSDATSMYPYANPTERLCFLRAADCFALPSLNENFGNTVVEAMQQGLPCVISDNVYLSDMIIAADAGEVCTYSEDSLFECLTTLASDASRRRKVAATGIVFARKFLPENIVEEYRELFLKAARVQQT